MSGLGKAVALALLLTSPSQALIFHSDDRTFSRPGDPRFSAIGLVKSSAGSGTGFLVDDCHVLTSRHILSEQNEVLGATLEFRPTLTSVAPEKGKVVARGNAIMTVRGKTNLNRNDDWLLIRLNKCIGLQLGFVSLSGDPAETGRRVLNAGFPIDRPRKAGLSIDPSCTIHYVTRIGLLHDCAFLPGNSGGPIFRLSNEGDSGPLQAIAIGSTGYTTRAVSSFNSQAANVGTPVAPILPALRQFIKPNFRGTDLDDKFMGSGLFDHIDGRAGTDTFILDRWGGDTLVGGNGADRFILTSASARGHYIEDFDPSEGDILSLDTIDADNTLAGRQSFKLRSDDETTSHGIVTLVCNASRTRTKISLFIRHRGRSNNAPDYEITVGRCINDMSGIRGLA